MAVQISTIDVGVIILYFVIVIAVGIISSLMSNKGNTQSFFLAGRSMNFILVGASLFGSNIGSGHFVGLGGSAAANGIAVAGFELNAAFVLIALGWLFVPVYIASGVFTMPEYLKLRYGGRRIRVYLSCLALLLYILTKISADLFAGALFVQQSFDINLYISVGVLIIIAMLFTVTGGLTAVIWTDTVQVVIMIIGAGVLMVKVFIVEGGYSGLIRKYFESIPSANYTIPNEPKCNGFPREDAMNMLRSIDKGDLPWTGMTFGVTVSAVWYWCSDQVIVQRTLSAKNYSHAKGGCVLAAWLKFLPLFILIFPAMAARIEFPEFIGCQGAEHCKAVCDLTSCSNVAYPRLVIKLLPAGLRGLMLACMLSALMSSLTSVFNSASTLFTMDIWKFLIRKRASEMELLIVGKVFIVVMVVISILWIPLIQSSTNTELFDYIQAITAYLAPPICACFVLAMFVPRVNETGVFWGLMSGLAIGLVRFVLEVSYGRVACGEEDTRISFVKDIHYLHFGLLLFVISCIIMYGISLMTKPIPAERLHRLTFWTRHSKATDYGVESEIEKAQKMSGVEDQSSIGVPRIVRLICCIPTPPDPVAGSSAEETEKDMSHLSLEEKPFYKNFWNVMAIAMMTGAVFMYTFYA